MDISGVIQGPPLLLQPAQLCMHISNPSRDASLAAWFIMSSHSSLMYLTGPGGIASVTLNASKPPRPTRFIASRSLVMPSRETFPFIQCHHVCDRADSGGLLKRSL